MKRIEHIAMIAHDMGLIFEFLGLASLLPFLILVIFQEWDMFIPMASAPVLFFVLGGLLSRVTYQDLEPSFLHDTYCCRDLVAGNRFYWCTSFCVRSAYDLHRQYF